MALAATAANLTGEYKEKYASKIENLIPEAAVIQRAVPFSTEDKLGNYYHQPVEVQAENGFTYAAPNSSTAYDLVDPNSMALQDAQIQGYEITIRSWLGMEAATRSLAPGAAFENAFSLQMKNQMRSLRMKIESLLLYGQSGLGTAATSANVSATSTTITITTAQFAAGLWAGALGAKFQFYTSNTTLVSSGDDSVFTITAINTTARTITVSGTQIGITALDAAILANPNDVYIYNNQSFGKEMAGINKILTNTGTLFNIDAATYNLWKSQSFSASGQLNFKKLQSAVATAVPYGLDETVQVLVNPLTWVSLSDEMVAYRQLDSSYSKKTLENGSEALSYMSQNGGMEIIAHICVKEGDAFVLPLRQFKRVGSMEVTKQIPGTDEMFFLLPTKSGFEHRAYTDQAIFCKTPAKCVKITGIVNA